MGRLAEALIVKHADESIYSNLPTKEQDNLSNTDDNHLETTSIEASLYPVLRHSSCHEVVFDTGCRVPFNRVSLEGVVI